MIASLVAPVCEVQKWVGCVNTGIAVESQKPLYSKLENYPETQDKSPNSILRLLPSYTSRKVVSGVSSRGSAFFPPGEYCEETLLCWITKLDLELLLTGDLQSLINSDRQKITNIKSIQMSKQMKKVRYKS